MRHQLVFALRSGFAASPGPSITSVNFALGDTTGGGQPIVITGTGLASVTNVTFGGTSATITGQTATTVTVSLPARPAGVVDIVVTNPGGSATLVNGFEFWTPAQISSIYGYLDSNKGVTQSAGAVSAWLDQSSNAANYTQATGANKPQQVANAFGTLPGIRFTPEQWLDGAGFIAVSAWSYFAVAKWTSTDTTFTFNLNTPLTLFGGAGWNGFGVSGGAIAYSKWDAGMVTAGSGLNDGNPHLIGATGDATPDIKFYLGATQQGPTASPGGTNLSYYTHVGDGYSNVDGFDGTVGALITVNGVISGGDRTKLNQWAQQRFGA